MIRGCIRSFTILNVSNVRNFIRSFRIYDKNFEYFRNKNDYKDLVVQMNELSQSNLAGPGFSFFINNENIHSEGIFYHFMQRENVMKLTTTQLKEIMCMMANIKIDAAKYGVVLKYLDEKCALSAERWPLDLSLYILDAWFIILGIKIFQKHYYSAVTSLWSRKLKKCSKLNLILMLYFIGMSKRAPPFLMEMFEDKMEKYILDFTDEEWAIACLSFFKTSKKINSHALLKHLCIVAENLLLKNDRFNLISVLKCLRLSQYFDLNLWNKLREYVIKEHRSFNFVECTNFLATFASRSMYDDEMFNYLENHCIFILSQQESSVKIDAYEETSKIHPSARSRVKDFARFLWAMTSVGHNVKNDTIDFMTDLVNKRLSVGDFESCDNHLVDCLQSFVIADHYPQNLLEYVLNPSFLAKISNTNKAKPRYQLYFIYRSSQISSPNICFHKTFDKLNPIPRNLHKDIKERKGFEDILKFLRQNMNHDAFKCCYIMPHIMIAGILINTDVKNQSVPCEETRLSFDRLQMLVNNGIICKNIKDFFQSYGPYISIEILDSSVCVHGTNKPLGLLETKIRQLKELNFNVISLTTDEINNLVQYNNYEHFCKIANLIV